MGTNYYLYRKEDPLRDLANLVGDVDGRDDELGKFNFPLHIGKSSYGWCFSLHVYPDEGINTLDDWKELFSLSGLYIEDEYGDLVDHEKMVDVITNRIYHQPRNYISWKDFHDRNYSEPGPNNLARCRIIHNHCIGHGEGTWDYIVGDFS